MQPFRFSQQILNFKSEFPEKKSLCSRLGCLATAAHISRPNNHYRARIVTQSPHIILHCSTAMRWLGLGVFRHEQLHNPTQVIDCSFGDILGTATHFAVNIMLWRKTTWYCAASIRLTFISVVHSRKDDRRYSNLF